MRVSRCVCVFVCMNTVHVCLCIVWSVYVYSRPTRNSILYVALVLGKYSVICCKSTSQKTAALRKGIVSNITHLTPNLFVCVHPIAGRKITLFYGRLGKGPSLNNLSVRLLVLSLHLIRIDLPF